MGNILTFKKHKKSLVLSKKKRKIKNKISMEFYSKKYKMNNYVKY